MHSLIIGRNISVYFYNYTLRLAPRYLTTGFETGCDDCCDVNFQKISYRSLIALFTDRGCNLSVLRLSECMHLASYFCLKVSPSPTYCTLSCFKQRSCFLESGSWPAQSSAHLLGISQSRLFFGQRSREVGRINGEASPLAQQAFVLIAMPLRASGTAQPSGPSTRHPNYRLSQPPS